MEAPLIDGGPPAARGIYDGKPIVVPLTGRAVTAPVGARAAASTAPEFNVFLLVGEPAGKPAPAPPRRKESGRDRRGRTS